MHRVRGWGAFFPGCSLSCLTSGSPISPVDHRGRRIDTPYIIYYYFGLIFWFVSFFFSNLQVMTICRTPKVGLQITTQHLYIARHKPEGGSPEGPIILAFEWRNVSFL